MKPPGARPWFDRTIGSKRNPGLRLRLEDFRRTLVLASAVEVHEIINTGLIDGEFEHCAVARRHLEGVDAVHRVSRISAAIDSAEQNAGDVKRCGQIRSGVDKK